MKIPAWLRRTQASGGRDERPEGRYEVYRRKGVKIGRDCILYNTTFDPLCPHLIEIGDEVAMADGVLILAHDGAPYVLAGKEVFAKVRIEDRAFIGTRAIILPGVTIGRESVLAAGSVVARDIPPRQVWGGNPARFICSVDDYLANLGKRGGVVLDIPRISPENPGYAAARDAHAKRLRDLADQGAFV